MRESKTDRENEREREIFITFLSVFKPLLLCWSYNICEKPLIFSLVGGNVICLHIAACSTQCDTPLHSNVTKVAPHLIRRQLRATVSMMH